MIDSYLREDKPNLVAIAGPNGAGKSTFFESHLSHVALPFVNADVIAHEMGIGAYEAAAIAGEMRRQLFARNEGFVFETVFSDPVGGKLSFLQEAVDTGYNVILCFIGIGSAEVSDERVALRVIQGGHDVPTDKIATRYPRTMENLRLSLLRLPLVLVYDNDDWREPHRFVLAAGNGVVQEKAEHLPEWLTPLLPD